MQLKEKKNNVPKYNPIFAVVAYTFGNMLIKGIPFITLPIFTSLLSTSDFGIYNTYLSYENIVSILLGLGLSGTVRIAKIEFKATFEKYISSIYGLQIIESLIIGSAIVFVFSQTSPHGWLDTKLLIILMINCLCTQLYNIASAKYAINTEIANNIIISCLMTLLNIGFSLIFCKFIFSEEKYLGRILGTFISFVVVAVIVLVLQLKRSCSLLHIAYWKFGLSKGIPLILHSLSLTLLAQCDKIMIQSLVGNSEAGIYSVAVTLTGIVTVLVTSIDNAWAPWFYKKLEENKYNDVYKLNNYMIIAFSVITISIMLISPEIIGLMTAPEYWESVDVFPILLTSVLFNFIYLIPVNFEYYYRKTGYIAISSLITAILNIGFNILFINKWGYIGAAYATSISKFILLLMHWLKAWKLQPKQLMGIKEVFCCTIIALVMSVIIVLCKSKMVIRYSLLAAMLLVVYIFAMKSRYIKQIIELSKKKKTRE